jgi:putative glutathione S-transferase
MGDQGWSFINDHPIAEQYNHQVITDSINHTDFLHQIYTKADKHYNGRVTVPVLWDKKTQTIVNNESAEIIRMFNSAFDQVGAKERDYYPAAKRQQIDELNEYIYNTINNGVYRAGFATTQQAYQQAVTELFTALEKIEATLCQNQYLTGDQITEADWRLFTTLVRFDAVYVGHFKCNIKRISDMPHLSRYIKDLYHQQGIAQTVNIDNIKAHYYTSHPSINPTRIIPKGPELDFLAK